MAGAIGWGTETKNATLECRGFFPGNGDKPQKAGTRRNRACPYHKTARGGQAVLSIAFV